jgi:osmotically-inducible protein OsmY
MTDSALELSIMETLGDSPVVHADEIAVQVTDGDAVLRGTVGSLIQRSEAVRVTAAVPGVRHVADELEVRLLGIDGRAEADTKAAVIDALVADERIHASDVDVAVEDGAVTLRGIVEVASQRERAQRLALGVPGVTTVHNELRVWLTVDAADVAERITDAIGAGAIVGADEVTVTVADNDVTLTGTVTSAAHHDAALAAAAGAPGVARVHDELTVRSFPAEHR